MKLLKGRSKASCLFLVGIFFPSRGAALPCWAPGAGEPDRRCGVQPADRQVESPPSVLSPSGTPRHHKDFMTARHRIQFPPADTQALEQDETAFFLVEADSKTRIRFHDYDQIYLRPGLYEQLFYDRLKCKSPTKVGQILKQTLDADERVMSELRVLDFGAGNGMMGEVLKSFGVARLIGADLIPQARDAAFRDRPDVYDEYYVADFTQLDDPLIEKINDWGIDCLTSVAALGFGDIPPTAFMSALRFVKPGGWVAFNIKETFLDKADRSGFSRFIRELIFSEYLDLWHIEKYRHRLSMEGTPLFYFAVVAQKTADIPVEFLAEHELVNGR